MWYSAYDTLATLSSVLPTAERQTRTSRACAATMASKLDNIRRVLMSTLSFCWTCMLVCECTQEPRQRLGSGTCTSRRRCVTPYARFDAHCRHTTGADGTWRTHACCCSPCSCVRPSSENRAFQVSTLEARSLAPAVDAKFSELTRRFTQG